MGICEKVATDFYGMAIDMKLLRGRDDGSCDHEVQHGCVHEHFPPACTSANTMKRFTKLLGIKALGGSPNVHTCLTLLYGRCGMSAFPSSRPMPLMWRPWRQNWRRCSTAPSHRCFPPSSPFTYSSTRTCGWCRCVGEGVTHGWTGPFLQSCLIPFPAPEVGCSLHHPSPPICYTGGQRPAPCHPRRLRNQCACQRILQGEHGSGWAVYGDSPPALVPPGTPSFPPVPLPCSPQINPCPLTLLLLPPPLRSVCPTLGGTLPCSPPWAKPAACSGPRRGLNSRGASLPPSYLMGGGGYCSLGHPGCATWRSSRWGEGEGRERRDFRRG